MFQLIETFQWNDLFYIRKLETNSQNCCKTGLCIAPASLSLEFFHVFLAVIRGEFSYMLFVEVLCFGW